MTYADQKTTLQTQVTFFHARVIDIAGDGDEKTIKFDDNMSIKLNFNSEDFPARCLKALEDTFGEIIND